MTVDLSSKNPHAWIGCKRVVMNKVIHDNVVEYIAFKHLAHNR